MRILLTKDSTRMGNAIIRRIIPMEEVATYSKGYADYLIEKKYQLFEVITDFGNMSRMNTAEVNECFLYGEERSFDEWWANRWEKTMDRQTDFYGPPEEQRPPSILGRGVRS